MFENKVLSKIFGDKGDGITGEWGKLRKAPLGNQPIGSRAPTPENSLAFPMNFFT